MNHLLDADPRPGFRLWLRYSDGVEGLVDLSDLAGRGVFEAWTELGVFGEAKVVGGGAVEWPGGVDLCADALYLRLTGSSPEEVFPTLRRVGADA